MTVDYDSVADDHGRRSFTVTWTTPEMAALSKTGCECSGCDYGSGKASAEQIAKIHPPRRGQCFRAVPGKHIKKWRSNGYKVTINDPFKKNK